MLQAPEPAPGIAPPPPPPALPGSAPSVAAIRALRRELSNQITSATERRNELAEQLMTTTEPGMRAGLEARIKILDERIVQLESDIASTGRQLTANPAGLVASSEPARVVFGGFSEGPALAISIVFTIFVLFPLALAAARLMWRRARTPGRTPLPPDAVQRLERIEQSVDAVAIEVERVTEGQRFLTKLLTERPLNALPAARPVEEPARIHAGTIETRGENR